MTEPSWPSSSGGLLARGHVPEASRLVLAPRRERLAVGRERDGEHRALVAGESSQLLAGGDVPHLDRLVPRARRGRFAIGREREAGKVLVGPDAPLVQVLGDDDGGAR